MRTTFGSATSAGEIATHLGAGRSAVPVVFDACLRPAVTSRWLRLTGWSAQRTLRVLKVSLGRPVTWIEQAQRNRDGRLWLELSELDIADWATVVSTEECRAEIEGEGRLVTGRFEHSSAEVLNLYVEGERTPIGTTASHPFWSQDRRAFVSAESLRTTERLRLENGRTAAVIRIEQLPGTQSVYNLEVDGEHVYHVGLHGVLVHNTCAPRRLTWGDLGKAQRDLLDDVLKGRRPRSALDELTPEQLEAGIDYYRSTGAAGRGALPNDLLSDFNSDRIRYLQQGGSAPGGVWDFADTWLKRQSPEWRAANSELVEKILRNIERMNRRRGG